MTGIRPHEMGVIVRSNAQLERAIRAVVICWVASGAMPSEFLEDLQA
jgi:hypothetical protein